MEIKIAGVFPVWLSRLLFAMAVGLACGMGYVVYAAAQRTLKIIIPEDLDYSDLFDDLFAEYTKKVSLEY